MKKICPCVSTTPSTSSADPCKEITIDSIACSIATDNQKTHFERGIMHSFLFRRKVQQMLDEYKTANRNNEWFVLQNAVQLVSGGKNLPRQEKPVECPKVVKVLGNGDEEVRWAGGKEKGQVRVRGREAARGGGEGGRDEELRKSRGETGRGRDWETDGRA